MASYVQKKKDYLNALVAMAAEASTFARRAQELISYGTDNGFLTGGANAIVDGDCVDSAAHLTASLVNSGTTAIGTMTLSNPNRVILRQCGSVVIP